MKNQPITPETIIADCYKKINDLENLPISCRALTVINRVKDLHTVIFLVQNNTLNIDPDFKSPDPNISHNGYIVNNIKKFLPKNAVWPAVEKVEGKRRYRKRVGKHPEPQAPVLKRTRRTGYERAKYERDKAMAKRDKMDKLEIKINTHPHNHPLRDNRI